MVRITGLLILMICFGCVKDNVETTDKGGTNELVGRWTRTEAYVNPGNGGSWVRTNDNPQLILEFTKEGKVLSNFSPYSDFSSYYKAGADSIELISSAGQKQYHIYSLTNNQLTIRFTCIEGCGNRFIKNR